MQPPRSGFQLGRCARSAQAQAARTRSACWALLRELARRSGGGRRWKPPHTWAAGKNSGPPCSVFFVLVLGPCSFFLVLFFRTLLEAGLGSSLWTNSYGKSILKNEGIFELRLADDKFLGMICSWEGASCNWTRSLHTCHRRKLLREGIFQTYFSEQEYLLSTFNSFRSLTPISSRFWSNNLILIITIWHFNLKRGRNRIIMVEK